MSPIERTDISTERRAPLAAPRGARGAERSGAGPLRVLAGVRVETPGGHCPVERLEPGDMVRAANGGYVRVASVEFERLTASDLHAHPQMRPLVIEAGSIGNLGPLHISPLQRIRVLSVDRGEPGPRARPRIVRALDLVGEIPGARIANDLNGAFYVRVAFARAAVVLTEGVEVEVGAQEAPAAAMLVVTPRLEPRPERAERSARMVGICAWAMLAGLLGMAAALTMGGGVLAAFGAYIGLGNTALLVIAAVIARKEDQGA